jgi:3-deoxy-D-manno-octulosonate 8-phosphate phosphatase (KDO 8-P phosphatase)
MQVHERAQRIELILSDVDGVMTDGSVVFDNQGIETKLFHIRDGLGIKLWTRTGCRFGMITGRSSHIVRMRAAELGVDIVRQGVEDKLAVVQRIVNEFHLSPERVCYLGDDLPDLPVLRYVGLAVTVPDGCEELRSAAHYVTTLPGGRGALRETIEMILKAQGRWDELVQRFRGQG